MCSVSSAVTGPTVSVFLGILPIHSAEIVQLMQNVQNEFYKNELQRKLHYDDFTAKILASIFAHV